MTPRRTSKSKSTGHSVKRRSQQISRLTARENAARERAFDVLSDLRRGDAVYSTLLRRHHLSGRTARKYLGRNLIGGSNGKRVRASKSDRLVRRLFFPEPVGDVPVLVRGSKAATKLSEFYRDRDKLLHGKLSPADFERKWRGMRVAGKEVFADTTEIIRIANAGALRVENLYASTGGER